MRVYIFLAKKLQRSPMELAMISNFYHRRPHKEIEIGTFESLARRPNKSRIHCFPMYLLSFKKERNRLASLALLIGIKWVVLQDGLRFEKVRVKRRKNLRKCKGENVKTGSTRAIRFFGMTFLITPHSNLSQKKQHVWSPYRKKSKIVKVKVEDIFHSPLRAITF